MRSIALAAVAALSVSAPALSQEMRFSQQPSLEEFQPRSCRVELNERPIAACTLVAFTSVDGDLNVHYAVSPERGITFAIAADAQPATYKGDRMVPVSFAFVRTSTAQTVYRLRSGFCMFPAPGTVACRVTTEDGSTFFAGAAR